MIQVLDPNYLAISAIVIIGYQLSFFFIAFALKFDKVTDFAGGTNFVVIALLTLILSQTYFTRQIIITVCVGLWGFRIAGFLLYRILKTEEDNRFDQIRGSFFPFLGFWIFQMLWVFTNTLCVMIVNSIQTDVPLGPSDYAGLVMFIVGFLCEFEADRSKDVFRDDPSNKGKFCNVSLWSISRHPNYFGEMLLWWGIWTLSSSSFTSSWMYVSLIGPIFTMCILLFLSGMNLSEPKYAVKFAKDPSYEEYVQRTSILIPLPKTLYGALPYIIKAIFLFEWPIYYTNNKQAIDGNRSMA